jgi:hypothetical protein
MINKHKTQTVAVKKSEKASADSGQNDPEFRPTYRHNAALNDDVDDEFNSEKDKDLFVNNNSQVAQDQVKAQRDKLSEVFKFFIVVFINCSVNIL